MDNVLLPDGDSDDNEADMRALLARDDAAVFIAERPDGSVCGYVEVGSRLYADGCRSSPVGYIEGWYVDPGVRREGYLRPATESASWARPS